MNGQPAPEMGPIPPSHTIMVKHKSPYHETYAHMFEPSLLQNVGNLRARVRRHSQWPILVKLSTVLRTEYC